MKSMRVSAAPFYGANLKDQLLCRSVYYCTLECREKTN